MKVSKEEFNDIVALHDIANEAVRITNDTPTGFAKIAAAEDALNKIWQLVSRLATCVEQPID